MNIVWIEDVLLDLAQCAENVSAAELRVAILNAAIVAKNTEKFHQRNGGAVESAVAVTTVERKSNVIYPEKFFPRIPKERPKQTE